MDHSYDPPWDQASLDLLRTRLASARLPVLPGLEPWVDGTPVAFVEALLDDWAAFDLDAHRSHLASLQHVRLQVDGSWTHALHVRSPHPDAMPLVVTHGWPSSFLEVVPVLDRLTRPERHGGRVEDAFHVVVPSLPGFAWSEPVPLEELAAARIADRWRTVMERLGYRRFMASGTDVGARTTAWLAARHGDAVVAAHLSTNALTSTPTGDLHDDPALDAEERAWLDRMTAWSHDEGAYHHLQSTKPATAALALADSPVAMASWVAEKWQAWGSRDLASQHVREDLLSLLTLLWTTGSLPSSVLHYRAHDLPPGPRPLHVEVPVSMYATEQDIGGVPPRRLAERQYPDLRWSVLTRGGHFLAAEEPDLFAQDLWGLREALR